MFSSGFGNTPKKNMLFEDNMNDIGGLDAMRYLESAGVADVRGQPTSSQFSSALYGQQQKGGNIGGIGQFARSLSIPVGNLTPSSLGGESFNQQQNRALSQMSRNSMSIGPPNVSSQLSNTLISRQGMSPTRGVSPDMLSLKQAGIGSRAPGLTISRNQSFPSTQSLAMNAIGSESMSHLRQQAQGRNGSSAMLDINEFPALKSVPQSGGITNGISNPFNLDQTEFPALAQRAPIGSQPTDSFNSKQPYVPEQDGRGDESSSKLGALGSLNSLGSLDGISSNQQSSQQKGIQVLQDNSIKNIPRSMLTDQYGVVGLLAFIKAAESDPTLVHLALGNDLTTLGLNLNSPDEYLTNAHVREKLAPIKLNRYGEDLLFYVYYTNPGDVLQLAAAAELYNRDWRYHKEERIWITRAPGVDPRMKSSTYEQGTYYYFDCQNWRKVAKEFLLEYEKLEERPHLPNLMSLHFNPAQHA